MVKESEELSEEEKRALRGSKFAPLPSLPPPRSQPQPRLAHPGGPLTTNKAAALARFLERKLQDPNGLDSINPHLVERAVQNAKRTVFAGGASNTGVIIRHVDSFGDSDSEGLPEQEEKVENSEPKKLKKKKKNKKKSEKKKKQLKIMEDSGCVAVGKKPKKKKLEL